MSRITHKIRWLAADYCPILNRNEKKYRQLIKKPRRSYTEPDKNQDHGAERWRKRPDGSTAVVETLRHDP